MDISCRMDDDDDDDVANAFLGFDFQMAKTVYILMITVYEGNMSSIWNTEYTLLYKHQWNTKWAFAPKTWYLHMWK